MQPGRWERIERLYHEARDKNAGDRAAFLDEACVGDESLRKEVESLLACKGEAEHFIDQPAVKAAAQVELRSYVGRTLLHYSVGEEIGHGGMGVVYKARDTQLNRVVALKVLPEAFAEDRERVTRFKREARLLASLSHPNIATIHGFEESDDKPFLVLELVEGKTLAERLRKGAISIAETLEICLQIAEGLEAAHEKGVIHRDLKPANVKITPEGKVKILDFGLAKAFHAEATAEDQEQSTVTSELMTHAGMILGTAPYMSPEQATGKAADKRADIWAFGCILYECLTGNRPFGGDSITEVVARILEAQPDLTRLPVQTPAFLRKLLHQCLQKDPKLRLRDIGEARIAISSFLIQPTEDQFISPAPVPAALSGRNKGIIAAGLIIVSALSAFTGWTLKPVPEVPSSRPVRLEARLSEKPLHTGWGNFAALSPDGRRLAFVTRDADRQQLQLRSLDDGLESETIRGTERAYAPFFSPDGLWLGYFTATGRIVELRKVSIFSGPSSVLSRIDLGYTGRFDEGRGATWGPGGVIVFSLSERGLMKVPAAGGAPEELTRLEEGETGHHWPQYLPGARHVLFVCYTAGGSRIEIVEVETGRRKIIHRAGRYPRYAASGHLLYADGGALFAAPFDLRGLEMTTVPVPVLQDVLVDGLTSGAAHYDVTANGTLVYLTGTASQSRYLIKWVDRIGKVKPLLGPNDYRYIRFSPDGRRLAVEIHDGAQVDIWVYSWDRDALSRVTFDAALDGVPIWSPDSAGVVFFSTREGEGLYWVRCDGSGSAVRLTKSDIRRVPRSWHPNGKFLAFLQRNMETGADIWILPLEGDSQSGWKAGEPTTFVQTPFNEAGPAFSPDGKWLAYHSDLSGKSEVYVRPFPGPGGSVLISIGGGAGPVWSSTGRELFYRSLPADDKKVQFMVVPYTVEGGTFRAEKPRVWVEERFSLPEGLLAYDLHPDGERIAVFEAAQEQVGERAERAVVILSFFEVIRQKLERDPSAGSRGQ